MRKTMMAWMLVASFGLLSCDSADNKSTDVSTPEDQVAAETDITPTDVAEDATLPICPDEVLLDGLLPCNCYGTVATDPDAQVPGCITQVVCCPTVQGLRCEDHELLEPSPEIVEEVAQEIVPEDVVEPQEIMEEIAEETVEVPVCPNEVDLSTHTPCTCKGTLVESVSEAMPDCTLTVVCCPFDGVKCE